MSVWKAMEPIGVAGMRPSVAAPRCDALKGAQSSNAPNIPERLTINSRDRAMNPTFRSSALVRLLLRALLRPLFRVRVTGDAGVFVNDRTLIVANHESFLDGLLLGAFLPIDAVFVVHAQVLTKWYFRLILRYVPHLAVDSASPLSIKLICRLVETGKPVVIFPEGRLTITGSLMKVYDGAAFVAAKTGATVVPVRIEGSGRSYFGRLAGIYPLKLFPKIRIAIQPRRQIPMPALPSAKLRRRRAGELMRRILLDMLVATRPQRTLSEAFLDAKATFGSRYRLVEDVRMKEESYGSLLRMALGLARLTSPFTRRGEVVGVVMPNAAPTLASSWAFGLRPRARYAQLHRRLRRSPRPPAPLPGSATWWPRGPSWKRRASATFSKAFPTSRSTTWRI